MDSEDFYSTMKFSDDSTLPHGEMTLSRLRVFLRFAPHATWVLDRRQSRFDIHVPFFDGTDWKSVICKMSAAEALHLLHEEDRPRACAYVSETPHNASALRCRWADDPDSWIKIEADQAEGDRDKSSPDHVRGTVSHLHPAVLEIENKQNEVRELKEKNRQLRADYEAAERANKNKSAFLANMSHEVRTPLAAILGFSELLQDDKISLDEQKQFVDIIRRNGSSLTKIIDDVLDLSKVEAGRLKLENIEFSFIDLINETMNLFQEHIRSKKLTIRFDYEEDFPEKILSDSGRVRQIIVNLISNAIKFTDEGGITLSLHHVQSNGCQLEISLKVRDTGIGLTEDQIKKLFVPYVQAERSTSRRFGGTGLGLALSKKLAQALGGDISIDDVPERIGSCFTLSFKAEVLPALRDLEKIDMQKVSRALHQDFNSASPALVAVTTQAHRVLLVEDSEDSQYLIGRLLTRYGTSYEVAGDGDEALKIAGEKQFDLILMDIQIPKLDGYEVTRRLRRKGYTGPIVALTAHAMEEEKYKSREAGCAAHLTKPLDTKKLFRTLDQFLKSDSGH